MKPQCGLCLAFILALASKIQADKFHSGQWINTDIAVNFELYVFEMIILRDIQKCIESCKAKKQCKFINFDHRASLCYHISSNSSVAFAREKRPGFYFGDKTEWKMVGYESCDECNNYGVCGLSDGGKYSKCQNSGCEPPENKTNAILLGNMFSVGNRIEYECMEGYKTYKTVPLTSMCLENGTWSSVEVECLPEYPSCRIGGKRINHEMTWLDGTYFTNGYINWYEGEPSSSQGGEDCVEIVENFNYKRKDVTCSSSCYFICEFIQT